MGQTIVDNLEYDGEIRAKAESGLLPSLNITHTIHWFPV